MYRRLRNFSFLVDRPIARRGAIAVISIPVASELILPEIRTRRVPLSLRRLIVGTKALAVSSISCLSATGIDITSELKITVVEPVVYRHLILTS